MRQNTLVGSVIVAIGLVVAAIILAFVVAVMKRADVPADLRVDQLEAEVSTLQADLENVREDVRRAQSDTRRILEEMVHIADSNGVLASPAVSPLAIAGSLGEHAGEAADIMKLAKSHFNIGITPPNNQTMLELLGVPRVGMSHECQSVTDVRLRALMETRRIGPISVTMIRPALDSLERIMTRLQATEPDIYAEIGTTGAICARFVPGSTRSISTHSWGTAIDLTLEDPFDRFPDGGTRLGLLILAGLFNEEGWYWGATYNREGSMHFEVGVETLRAWAAAGEL